MQAMVHLKQFERLEPKQEYLCSRPAALVLQLFVMTTMATEGSHLIILITTIELRFLAKSVVQNRLR